MTHVDCPACKSGLTTTSNTPNIKNHIKNRAARETLERYMIGDNVPIPHAEWLKANIKVVQSFSEVWVVNP